MIRSAMIAVAIVAGLATPALAEREATTDGLFVNIRSGPGVNYPPICLAWPNVRFTVTERQGNWYHVEYLRSSGWMSANHVVIQE